MTEEEIEANAASDPDNPPWTEEDFRNARLIQPGSASKPVIWVHVDEDVRQWVNQRAGDTDQVINDLLSGSGWSAAPDWYVGKGVRSAAWSARTRSCTASRQSAVDSPGADSKYAFMAQVIVRNLDEQVVSSLKIKAELHGHSLEQELREILKRAAPLTSEEKIALANRIAAMTPRPLETESAELIREDRDSR